MSARLLALCCALALRVSVGAAQDANVSVHVHADSDETTVVTPRVRASTPIDDATRVDVAYVADVWTSASIDIRTSASKPVTERRDELDASVRREFGDAALGVGYRFSTEPDYESHGLSIASEYAAAQRDTIVSVTGTALFDRVGRAGFPAFERPLTSWTARVVVTQVLDPNTLVQLIDEFGYADGYLSSPYRFVGIGTSDGACRERQGLCLRESNPDQRLRNASAIVARRALTDSVSTGAAYRFYLDDWALTSHTVSVDVSWLPVPPLMLQLRYRGYGQTRARHYQPRFRSRQDAGREFTRDKELGPMTSHQLALDFEHSLALDPSGAALRASASVGPTLYLYSDFPPLRRIIAVSATVGLTLVL